MCSAAVQLHYVVLLVIIIIAVVTMQFISRTLNISETLKIFYVSNIIKEIQIVV